MTISSTVRIAGPFTGNGVTTTFPFAFKVFTSADLLVVRETIATGIETTLVIVTDYTVTLNADQNGSPGGSVVLLSALAATYTLTITSAVEVLQPTDLTNQGGFYPEVITDALDRATIQIQQLADSVTRSIKIPLSDELPLNMDVPTVALRQGKYLAFDATGEPTASAGTGTDNTLRTDLAADGGWALVDSTDVTMAGPVIVTSNLTTNAHLAVSGNTSIASLNATTIAGSGNLAIATNKFTVNATSGNTAVLGTLGVTGASTLASLGVTGAATIGTTLAVTGNATFDTTTLFVDSANNRVGVGTITPSVDLDVNGIFSSNNICFYAIPNTAITAISTTIPMGEFYDPYNVFASNIFTAVTTGVYFFSYSLRAFPSATTFTGSACFFYGPTPSLTGHSIISGATVDVDDLMLSASIIIPLTAGQTVGVRTHTGMTSCSIGGTGGYGTFIGYMLQ